MWNEALVFNITREILKDISMELCILSDNKLANDDLIGRCRIGLDAEGEQRVHWHDLISSKSAVPQWHPLL